MEVLDGFSRFAAEGVKFATEDHESRRALPAIVNSQSAVKKSELSQTARCCSMQLARYVTYFHARDNSSPLDT